ncbi:MAG TPA: tetratricopeptide repeat protein, partial [Kofleriaceae bacterium]|nr:tetratricopeptide repeat protein [Kofleriaceae bacterium]
EALYGERPFDGRDRGAIRAPRSHSRPGSDSTTRPGRTDATPRAHEPHRDGAPVPAWLRKVVVRGLSIDPAARYPSLTALLDALADDPAPPRRRRVVLACGFAAAIAIGATAVLVAREPAPSCQIDAGELAGAWDAPRRQVVAAGLAASGSVHAVEMTAKVDAALDAYAQSWLATRQATCEATRVRGEQSEQALDLRVACLDRSRGELRELVELLAGADRTLADHAVEAVYRLRDPSTCRGDTASDPVPSDPVARRILDAAHASLDRASALLAAGRYKAAAGGAAAVASLVDGFDVPRLHGEALLARGRAEQAAGDLERAEATLYEALAAAERGRDDTLAAAIWVELVLTTGPSQHRFEIARSDARAADAALSRIEAGPRLKFRYGYTMGIMLLVEGKLEPARERLERTLAAVEPDRPGDRGLVHSALCNAELQLGHRDRAREHCTTSIELLQSTFGPSHPKLATALNTLGALEHAERHWAEARRRFEQVAQMFESNGQVNDLVYALAVSNVGATLVELEKLDDAIPYFTRARELFAAYNPTHPQRVIPLEGLGSIAFRNSDLPTAIRYYEEAHTLEASYDARDPGRNLTLLNLAVAYRQHGDTDKAKPLLDEILAHYQDKPAWRIVAHALDEQASLADDRKDYKTAVALRSKSLAALDHDDDPLLRAESESMLGSSLRRLGDPRHAVAPLEKAVAYFDTHAGTTFTEALCRFALAQALWEAGGDRGRAVHLARAARDLLATTVGANLVEHRDEIDRWLARHSGE